MWKTLSIVAAILTAGAAFFSYKNVNQFKNERVLLAIARENQAKAEKHLAEVKQALATDTEGRKKTESERDQIVADTEALKPKIDAAIKEIADKQADLDTVTARWTEVKKQVDDAGGIETLKTQLTSLSQQKDALDSEVASLKAQTTALTGRFDALNQQIADLRRRETWQARGIIQDGFRATIVQVDRDFGFITLNAGNSRGVVSGATLDIRRGSETVGQAKVTNVEQSYAVADLVGVSAANVQVGDAVVVSAASNGRNWRPDQPTAPAAQPGGATPAAPATDAPPPALDTPADPFADPAGTAPSEPAAPTEPAPAAPEEPAPAEAAPAETPAETPADPFAN
jgi:predicted  nucleic acid-binding Zn-ribbon protein